MNVINHIVLKQIIMSIARIRCLLQDWKTSFLTTEIMSMDTNVSNTILL